MESIIVWAQFSLLTVVITFAGYKLSVYADLIADATGLGRNLMGLIMLSTITSLPELMTGISSIRFNDNPDIAVGDIMGSCVFNLVIVSLIDFFYEGKGTAFSKSTKGHIMSAGLGMFMISLVGFFMLVGPIRGARIGHIGIYSILIPIFYLVAMRTSYTFERENNVASELAESKITMKRAVVYFILAALTIVLAGAALPFVGERIVHIMEWNSAFVGTAFIALATSLPEFAVTISAVKIGAAEMALSNVLGSNIFNIIILAIDDVLYTKGPLLAGVAQSHSVTVLAALMMTSLIVIGLIMPPKKRYFNRVSMISIFLVVIFILNMYISYTDGVAVPK